MLVNGKKLFWAGWRHGLIRKLQYCHLDTTNVGHRVRRTSWGLGEHASKVLLICAVWVGGVLNVIGQEMCDFMSVNSTHSHSQLGLCWRYVRVPVVTFQRKGGPFSVEFQLSGSPIDLHRAPWTLVIDELGSRRNALRRSILTAFINLFLTQYQATLIVFTSLF